MFGLSAQESFILGIAALWVYSAAVAALPEPDASSSKVYSWLYKFLKAISGDLSSKFGSYIPTESTSVKSSETTVVKVIIVTALMLGASCAWAQGPKPPQPPPGPCSVQLAEANVTIAKLKQQLAQLPSLLNKHEFDDAQKDQQEAQTKLDAAKKTVLSWTFSMKFQSS
jgi:hypothetical protein